MAKNVFITGTNSGIGRLTALKLAFHGHQVFATMREVATTHAKDASDLCAAADKWPGSIRVYDMDLAADNSVEGAVERALEDAGHFDTLINNAAFTTMGLQETVSHDDLLYQLDVNVVGPHRVLRAVLPSMRERGAGFLIHVTGILGRLVLPAMGTFCASKAAYEALAEAYRYELAPLNIDSTIVQPGFFPTGFADRIEMGEDHARAAGYGPNSDRADKLGASIASMIKPPAAADPDQVATTIALLVNARRGTRPPRVVVDAVHGALVGEINAAHTEAQADFLTAMGMDDLA